MKPFAIIGGTGVYQFGDGINEEIRTPYGDAMITRMSIDGNDVVFLARHGTKHSLPPHRINYRANIWALHSLGIRDVLATQAVGSLNQHMPPGCFVLLEQFIDWTRGRDTTFFDGDNGQVVHVDVSQPYCPRINNMVNQAGTAENIPICIDAVYACTEGPRFESSAEVKLLQQFGADVVGMTNVPEVVLAREAGLCYSALCIVCNWGAGMTANPLTHTEVLDIMAKETHNLHKIISIMVTERDLAGCQCSELGFSHLLPLLV